MKLLQKFSIISFLILLLPALVDAQGCIGGIDPGCSPDDYCPCPIDNGVLLLIAVVLGIAAKKAIDLKKKASAC